MGLDNLFVELEFRQGRLEASAVGTEDHPAAPAVVLPPIVWGVGFGVRLLGLGFGF